MLINNRYRLIKQLRELNAAYPTDIFEAQDWGSGSDDWGSRKILKVLKYSNNPDLVRLFKQEARTLMFLRNLGIPRVEPDGYFTVTLPKGKQVHCLVMEFIEGENLVDFVETNGPISQKQALDWLQQLAKILNQIHSQNLLHRDIKPSNMILRPNGQLALIDFGTVGVGKWGVTQVGTTGYAAPEQIIGSAVLQSDFFALGRTFVYLLTGRPPMDFAEHPKTGQLIWRNSVKRLSKDLADLIDDLMASVPEKRPQNTQVILRRLLEIISPELRYLANLKRKLKLTLLVSLGIITSVFLFVQILSLVNRYFDLKLDKTLQNIGTENYTAKKLGKAELFYKLALILKPENMAAHYSIGRICEERKDFDCARKKYQIVIQSSKKKVAAAAISRLTRLQILYKDGAVSVDSILQGLKLTDDSIIKSNLYNNLGWVRWEQNRYEEAETNLRTSIKLYGDRASAHCLLAQVLEVKGEKANSLVEWESCHRLANTDIQEETTWQSTARQRLGINKEKH
ncbi:protein kinase [Aerosakkonemataceae cyanobacterium BLCC-F50]|uniref:non-specific serine/threonine protein kinase n=1 Tax=Floridaenema flaviceps BLCC-F50 TaxID=3153642 RepID=A0ABV4XIU2_9CYAN